MQMQVEKGALQSVLPDPNPPNGCQVFDGWYTSDGSWVQTLDSDQTVVAHWNTKKVTVTYEFRPGSAGGKRENLKQSETFDCGANITLQPFNNVGSMTLTDMGWYEVTFPNLGKVVLYYITYESGATVTSMSHKLEENMNIIVEYFMSSTL